MQRPTRQDRLLRLCGRGLLFASVAGFLSMASRGETPPKPSLRIPLNELGFPGYAVSLMHAGASMATVHMLDGSHVLFTYSLRSLVPRLPGDDVNDSDRQVAAVLLEIPSGKVLARTKWHLHDHGRYLWSVGRGAFVVRTGGELSVFAPLQGLASGTDPFRRLALMHRPGQPVAVNGSPDGKIIIVELEHERPAAEGDGEADGEQRKKSYTVEFFRLLPGPSPKDPLEVAGAGAVASPVLLRLPLDGDGYLWAEDGERGRWTVSFNEFGGKEQKLAPLMSSCRPHLTLLSRSQFLAETCRGSDEQPMFAAFGFDGHENWQEQFGESLQPPTLALAPAAGRFAMSRLVASSGGAPVSGMGEDNPLSQEIRVYQTESGDLLLRLQCVPAVRSAENFDLSPDGQTLAVLAPETLDLYRLPELSVRDRKDLAEVQSMTPPEGSGPVLLGRITRPIGASEPRDRGGVAGAKPVGGTPVPAESASGARSEAAAASQESVTAGAGNGPADQAKAASAQVAGNGPGNEGAAAPATRKAPTLLGPGESAEFKGQGGGPK